jgi:hypothetical protein
VRGALGAGVSGTLTVRPSPLSSACTQAQAAAATTAATVTFMTDIVPPLHRSEQKMLLHGHQKLSTFCPKKKNSESGSVARAIIYKAQF